MMGYPCIECNISLASKEVLYSHKLRIHNGYLKYKCTLCDTALPTNYDLRKHIRSAHLGIHRYNSYRCTVCDRSFKGKHCLDHHRVRVHGEGLGKSYKCQECDYRSNLQSYLKNHVRTQHEEKRTLKCSICEIDLPTKHRFNNHMRFRHDHVGKKDSYKCQQCTFESLDRHKLTRHQQTHIKMKGRRQHNAGEVS